MIHEELKVLSTKEEEDFSKAELDLNPTYAPTQQEIIDLIDYYWVDKFRDGDYTPSGWKKPFYNIIANPVLVSMKMIDLDTKDINIIAEDGASYYPAWLFQRDLNFYMKDKRFGVFLNELVFNLPKYGTIIVQKSNNMPVLVSMRDIITDTDIEELEEVSFLQQRYRNITPSLLRNMPYDEDKIEEAIRESSTEGVVNLRSRFGNVSWSDNNYFVYTTEGVVLWETKFDSIRDIYRKLDWDTIPGRFLGRGTVEKLFESQIQVNRIADYKTEGLHWTSKHIFQTRDFTFEKNLTTDVENGEVLMLSSELTEVNNQEKNLAAYASEENRWDKLAKDLTFSFPELSGERPPAGTPLGTSVLTTQQASGFFDVKREDIGMFLKDIILDWIIPSFKDKNVIDHKLMISQMPSEDLQTLQNLFVKQRTNKEIFNFISQNGRIPDVETVQLMQGIAKEQVKKEKEVLIPANFYDNIKYKVDVVITNEQIDTAAKLSSLQTISGLLASNPAILEDPRTKKVFMKMVDLAGFNPNDLGLDDEAPDIQQALGALRPGGSIAKPQVPTTPQLSENTQTV